MITIKTAKGENEYGGAEVHIAGETPLTTIMLGAEALIEQLVKFSPNNSIDWVLDNIKRIYERDNKEEK